MKDHIDEGEQHAQRYRPHFFTRRDLRRDGFLLDEGGWNTREGFVHSSMRALAIARVITHKDMADGDGAERALQLVEKHLREDDPAWTLRSPRSWAD